jgi:hypothetical protein
MSATKFSVYVPTGDDFNEHADTYTKEISEKFGGCTEIPFNGAWIDPATHQIVRDFGVILYTYVDGLRDSEAREFFTQLANRIKTELAQQSVLISEEPAKIDFI